MCMKLQSRRLVMLLLRGFCLRSLRSRHLFHDWGGCPA